MFPELSDETWMQKLAFFSDLTTHLAALNRDLQGKMRTVWDSYTKIAEFKMKLELIRSEFQADNLENFQNLNSIKLCGGTVKVAFFAEWIDELRADFDVRFDDFKSITSLLKFAKSPAEQTIEDMSIISEKLNLPKQSLQTELNKYKSETLLIKDESLKILKTFPTLKVAYAKILSLFSSSYACESAFSKLNFIFNQFRSNLTQQNLENCLTIASTTIELSLEGIVANLQCRLSE